MTLHGRGSRTESPSRSPPGKSVASVASFSSPGKLHPSDLSPPGKPVAPVEVFHHGVSCRTPSSFSGPGKSVAPRRDCSRTRPGKSVAPIESFSSQGKLHHQISHRRVSPSHRLDFSVTVSCRTSLSSSGPGKSVAPRRQISHRRVTRSHPPQFSIAGQASVFLTPG